MGGRRGGAGASAGRLPGTTTGLDAPMLPGMDAVDELVADVWATGLSPGQPSGAVRPGAAWTRARRAADVRAA